MHPFFLILLLIIFFGILGLVLRRRSSADKFLYDVDGSDDDPNKIDRDPTIPGTTAWYLHQTD